MLRIASLFTVVMVATAVQACTPEGDDPFYTSSEAALETSGERALDVTKLPADWKVVENTPPGVVAVAIPAGLTIASATCPSGAVCVFQDSNRGGAGFAISLAAGVGFNLTSLSCPSCTNGIHGNNGTFNDQMTSWENASSVRYCWAFNVNGGGERHPMNVGVALQNVFSRENDQASSVDRLACP